MSSKRNKKKNNKNAILNNPNEKQNITVNITEKISEQLNDEDEPAELSSNSISLLAEYERQEQEAEQRRAERQRQAELEKAEKERRASTPAVLQDPPASLPPEDSMRRRALASEQVQEEEHEEIRTYVPKESSSGEDNGFSGGINEALSENADDVSNVDPADSTESGSDEEKVQERPKRFYLVFAVFVIIMSVIGVISTVNFISGVVSNIANRTDLKNELALFLYPIVSVDPPDCDDVTDLPSTTVIEAAIWKIILTGDNSNYEKQYNTYMYVPAIDVEFSVRSMFGNSVEIKHETVGTMDITFTYYEEMNSYLVPINPHYTAYSPRVTDVTNIGETYTVTVEYIPPSALSVKGIEFETAAVKTMVYTLSKSRSSIVLHSIRNITRYGNSNEY